MKDVFRTLRRSVLNVLFPPRCLVCGISVSGMEPSLPLSALDKLCVNCAVAAPDTYLWERAEFCPRCLCSSHHGAAEGHCVPCSFIPPWIDNLWSLYLFDDSIAELIKCFKYRKRWSLAPYLAELLAESGAVERLEAELLIPLPSGREQITHRGYAHTAFLASAVSRYTGVPKAAFVLHSVRARKSQAELRGRSRQNNMRNAFSARPKRIKGRRILLIDDTITSGASVFEAARALYTAQAASVSVLTLARSPRFLSNLLENAETRSNYRSFACPS